MRLLLLGVDWVGAADGADEEPREVAISFALGGLLTETFDGTDHSGRPAPGNRER
jgi:hypothetical protein